MKKEATDQLSRKVTVRFTSKEYQKIITGFKNSTKQQLSGYIRSILLEKPITVYTRNGFYDAFVAEMILLRRELNMIGNNFNQSVKKLHVLSEIEEIKTWVILNESSKQNLFKKIAEINFKIALISDKWSQE